MPVHDWTRVPDATFHHFHGCWISALCKPLMEGVLPPGYYAQSEQVGGPFVADVVALHVEPLAGSSSGNGLAVLDRPAVRFVASASGPTTSRRRRISIRHVSTDVAVAFVEVISPGNRTGEKARRYIRKATRLIHRGVHLLMLDLFPPTRRRPGGLHGAIWSQFSDERYVPPPGEPLTLASYDAAPVPQAYVEPIAVGRELPPMPLFLEPGRHVTLPLAGAYAEAYRLVAPQYRAALEAP